MAARAIIKPLALAVAVVLAVPEASAFSQPAPAAAQPRLEPAALAAAERLLAAMDYDRMMQRTLDAMLANMGQTLKQSIESRTGKPVDDELVRRLTAIQGDFLRSTIVNSPDMRRAIATIYAARFSAAELDHLAGLYKDPVMRKWSEVGPLATAEMMPLIQSVVEAQRPALEQRIKAAVINYFEEQGKGPSS